MSESPYLLHHVRVTEVQDLSPTFARITVSGPLLDRVKPTGRDQRIKIFLPLPDVGVTTVPTVQVVELSGFRFSLPPTVVRIVVPSWT